MASAPPSPLDLLTGLLAESVNPRIVDDPAVWSLVQQHARRHGVAPLIASLLRSHVSRDRRDWCDRVLAMSWQQHRQSLAALESALQILDRACIPCLVLKGPVLALRHYQPPFLRKPSADIDLVVRNAELEAAVGAFSQAGYDGVWPLAEARARSHHFELAKAGHRGIELHFRLSHGAYGIPVEEFFDRAVGFTLPGGREVQVLSPADEILHLILHRAHGRFATLFHFYEIRRLWSAAGLAVKEKVIRRAIEHHFAGAVALTDAGFRARWNEPFLPPEIELPRSWLQRRFGISIGEELYYKFEHLSDPGRTLPLGARLGRRWLDFQLTDTSADAMRFLGILARVAWFQLWRGGWKTVRVEAQKGRESEES